MTRIVRSMPVLGALMGVLLAWAQPAAAQFFGGGNVSQYMSPIGKRDVDTYALLLGLDADQKDAALSLLEGYRTSFKELTAEMEKGMQELQDKFQDTQDMSVFQKEMPKVVKGFAEKMEALEKGYFADLKTLVNERQLENWARVERARRRQTGLRFGLISGQAVDLSDITRRIGAWEGASPDLVQELDRYESDMDKDLLAMEKFGRDQQDAAFEGAMAFDMEKISAMMTQITELSRAMRNTNREHARVIGSLLPADKVAPFGDEVKRRSYPRVYRQSHVAKSLAAAKGFNDLDAQQRQDLASIEESYKHDLESANAKWAAAIDEREEKSGSSIQAMMQMAMGQGEPNDAVGEARKARKELDERVKDKLKTLLRQEQWARLPEEKPEKGGEFGFFASGDLDSLQEGSDEEEGPR